MTKQFHVVNHNDQGEWILASYSVRPSRTARGRWMATKDVPSGTPEADAGMTVIQDNLDERTAVQTAQSLRDQEVVRLLAAGYRVTAAQNH